MAYSLAIITCNETGRSFLSVVDHDGDFVTEVPDVTTGREVIENIEQYEEYLADMAEDIATSDDIIFDENSLDLELSIPDCDHEFYWE